MGVMIDWRVTSFSLIPITAGDSCVVPTAYPLPSELGVQVVRCTLVHVGRDREINTTTTLGQHSYLVCDKALAETDSFCVTMTKTHCKVPSRNSLLLFRDASFLIGEPVCVGTAKLN